MLVNNLEKFIDKEDLEFAHKIESTQCNAYKNKYNDILFNHDFKINETLDEGYERVRSKYERRLKRLYSQIEQSNKVLVVYIQLPNKKEILNDATLIDAYNALKEKFGDKINILYLHNTENIKLNNRKSTKINQHIEKVTFDYNGYNPELDYAVNFKLLRKYFSIYQISAKFMDRKNFFRRLKFRIRFLLTYIQQLKIESKK